MLNQTVTTAYEFAALLLSVILLLVLILDTKKDSANCHARNTNHLLKKAV